MIDWLRKGDGASEVMMGALVGSAFSLYLGWSTLVVAPACAAMWRMGGSDGYKKAVRRYGVPAALCIPLVMLSGDWLFGISFGVCHVALRLGYGLPREGHVTGGSTIGRWVIRLTKGDRSKASFISRGIPLAIFGAGLLPLWRHDPVAYLVGLVTLAVGFTVIRYLRSAK